MAEYLTWMLTVGTAVFEILGVLTAFHAVMHARTAQGATAWAVSLITFPFVALPLYWVFGRSKFYGYIKARRSDDARVQHFIATFKERYAPLKPPTREEQSYAQVLEQLGRLPFSGFNRTRLLIDGNATFEAMFAGIDQAQEYIAAQFFIIRDDELGKTFQAKLIEKARRGVRVYLLYDEFGCHKLPNTYLRELTDAGVEVSGFKSTSGGWNRLQLNFRNHRKIVIIDGRLAFVGGLNVGDEYLGKNKRIGRWRDTCLEVEGPAVECVQVAFVEDWHWATKQVPQLKWEAEKSKTGRKQVMVLPTGPADQIETCALFFSQSINAARERVWIASPYFVPDSQIMTCLQLAALRGVDVRILLPGKPDHLLVYLSSFEFIKQVEPTGVKFYRYQEGFLHQKVLLVDDHIAAVGTANLDNRSFRLNFELMMVVIDKRFASEVEAMMREDFSNSRPVGPSEYDNRPFLFKVAVRTSKLLSPIQ